jgi:hypothetical protein
MRFAWLWKKTWPSWVLVLCDALSEWAGCTATHSAQGVSYVQHACWTEEVDTRAGSRNGLFQWETLNLKLNLIVVAPMVQSWEKSQIPPFLIFIFRWMHEWMNLIDLNFLRSENWASCHLCTIFVYCLQNKPLLRFSPGRSYMVPL